MHEQTADAERAVARPNDSARRAALDLLDVADRAGVEVTGLSISVYDGVAWSANLHGMSADGTRQMTHTDGLRIVLRLGARSELQIGDPVHASRDPHVVMRAKRGGVEVSVFCSPSPAQLARLAQDEADRAAARAARAQAAAAAL